VIVRLAFLCAFAASACSHGVDGVNRGEGEGENAAGEGEGRAGEGEAGEGEGATGEGEGAAGEGEGAAGEGEGEGEVQPNGCVDDVTAGDHAFTCGGLLTEAHVPAQCTSSCGLILELHGDTGDGDLIEQHLALYAQGDANGYIIVAPTGPPYGFGQPGSTWNASDDAILVSAVQDFIQAFHVDVKRVHVTGFSRGGFVTWRLICDHSDLFASAAPGGAGDGTNFGEATCFSDGRTPAHPIPILFLMGLKDAAVGYPSMQTIRDAAVSTYGASGPTVVDSDSTYTHNRWTTSSSNLVIETFEHSYATVPDGPWASAQGHCIPGSTVDPYAPQYAIPCQLPNSFIWGQQVMQFFLAHPAP
jgi:pimeloyl-ACP methyl ester carboxylesterase